MLEELTADKKTELNKNDDLLESSPEEKATVKEFTEVLDKIKSEDEFTSEDWYLKGKEAFDANQNDEAIQLFNKSLAHAIDQKEYVVFFSHFYKAFAYRKLNKDNNALVEINKALMLEEKDIAYVLRAIIYENLKDFTNALKDVEKALEITPDYQTALAVREDVSKKMSEGV